MDAPHHVPIAAEIGPQPVGPTALSEPLLDRFCEVSDDYVSQCSSQDGAYKMGPQITRLQAGLVMLSTYRAQYVIDAMERWRRKRTSELYQRGLELHTVKKALVTVETIQFTTMLRLLEERVVMHPDSALVLQERAFEIIVQADNFLSGQDLSKHHDHLVGVCQDMLGGLCRVQMTSVAEKFQDLLKARLHADQAAKDQIPALCLGLRKVKIPLENTTDVNNALAALARMHPLQPIWKDVQKKSRVQHVICDMLCAMLERTANDGLPMANKAAISKQAFTQFYDTIQAMLEEILAWLSKKTKHWASGYPLATALMCICIQQREFALSRFDAFVEKLHKLLRDKLFSDAAHRLVGFKCLAHCVRNYAQTHSTDSDLAARLGKLLDPAVGALRKGTIAQHPAHLRVMCDLCVECMSYAPLYFTQLLVLLLHHEMWECVSEGVRATIDVMIRSAARLSQASLVDVNDGKLPEGGSNLSNLPQRGISLADSNASPSFHSMQSVPSLPLPPTPSTTLGATTSLPHPLAPSSFASNASLPLPPSTGALPPRSEAAAGAGGEGGVAVTLVAQEEPLQRALDLIRRGSHPLELYTVNELAKEFAGPMAHVLQACWRIHGERLMHKPSGGSEGHSARNFALALDVFIQALRLAPICEPAHWTEGNGQVLAEKLAVLNMHSSRPVREQAHRTQMAFIQGHPKYRNSIVVAMCYLVNRVPWNENHHEHIGMLLIRLLRHWLSVIARDKQLYSMERIAPEGPRLDVASVEGCGLLMLCNSNPRIRRQGWEVLSQVRALSRAEHEQVAEAADPSQPPPPMHGLHVIGVLEQVGDDVMRENFWNYGQCSSLLQQFKEAPEDLKIRDFLATADNARWAAVLPHLLRELLILCPTSALSAYEQVSMHMHALSRQDGRYNAVPAEGAVLELWKLYNAFLCASIPYPGARRPVGVKSQDELLTGMLTLLKSGVDAHMHAASVALGYCHPDHLPILNPQLLDMYQDTVGDVTRKATRLVRREDMRLHLAHIFRACAHNLPPDHLILHRSIAQHFCKFLNLAMQHATSGQSMEILELRYCIAAVAHSVLEQSKAADTPLVAADLRGRLWDALESWLAAIAGVSGVGDRHLARMSSAMGKAKDPESRAAAHAAARKLTDALKLTSFQTMGALLSGPLWDDAMHQRGTALAWFDAALGNRRSQPSELLGNVASTHSLAQVPLREMMLSNPQLAPQMLDRCYARDAALSEAYFHVFAGLCTHLHAESSNGGSIAGHSGALAGLSTALSAQSGVLGDPGVRAKGVGAFWKPHELLAVVLHRLVDPSEVARAAALSVMRVLLAALQAKTRKSQVAADAAVVLGQLQESYVSVQADVSARMATAHRSLAPHLLREALTRQLSLDDCPCRQHVLACLVPWAEHVVLDKREGARSGELLALLYQATYRFGSECPTQVRDLWTTLSATPDNPNILVHFVLSRALEEANVSPNFRSQDCLDVSKRIVLWACMKVPQLVVDDLMADCAQLISEELPSNLADPRKFARIPLLSLAQQREDAGLRAVSTRGPSLHSSLDTAVMPSPSKPGLAASPGAFRPPLPASFSSYNEPRHSYPDLHKVWDAMPGGVPPSADSLAASGFMGSASAASGGGGGRSVAVSMDRSSAHSNTAPLGGSHERKLTRDTSFGSDDMSAMVIRQLSRAEVALCMLAELAHHHEDVFRGHLPVLLLISVIKIDCTDELVHRHAHQTIINLIYSMAARSLEAHAESGMTEKYHAVAAVVHELQMASSGQMWPAETVTYDSPHGATFPVLKRLVLQVVDCMFVESDLKSKWVEESMNWAMHVPSLTVAQRCLHVARALTPPLSPSLVLVLLNALLQCYMHPSITAFDFTGQILLALVELLSHSNPNDVKMYPQLFWACLGLLQSVHVPVFVLVLDVLNALLARLELWNLPTQQILQAGACPAREATLPSGVLCMRPWLLGCHLYNLPGLSCVQQVLWKGFLHPHTQYATMHVLTNLLRQLSSSLGARAGAAGVCTFQPGMKDMAAGGGAASPAAHGMSLILGTCSYQLVAGVVSGLMWVLGHRHEAKSRTQVVTFCQTAAEACIAFGAAEVAPRITAFAASAGVPETTPKDLSGHQTLIQNFTDPFVACFFPEHAALVLVFCTLMLVAGPSTYQTPLLMMLTAFYRSPNLKLGEFAGSMEHAAVLRTLTLLVEGSNSAQVLQLMDIVLSHLAMGGGVNSGAQGRGSSYGEEFRTPLPTDLIPVPGAGDSGLMVVDTLQRCVAAIQTHSSSQSGWSNRSRFLPFLKQE